MDIIVPSQFLSHTPFKCHNYILNIGSIDIEYITHVVYLDF